jgi:Bacterial protein of unknown function (DUF903)
VPEYAADIERRFARDARKRRKRVPQAVHVERPHQVGRSVKAYLDSGPGCGGLLSPLHKPLSPNAKNARRWPATLAHALGVRHASAQTDAPAKRLDTQRPAGIKRKLAISKMVRVVALALLFGLLADYASSHYIISTNSGTMIQTNGEPKFNKDTLMYEHEYEELDGNNGSIKQADATRSSSSSLA